MLEDFKPSTNKPSMYKMFELLTAASTCRFSFATLETTAHKSGNSAHATGKGPVGSAMSRNFRGAGPMRSFGSIAAQLPFASPSLIGPSRSTTLRASSNVSVVRIAFGSSPERGALYSPRRSSRTLSNAIAACATLPVTPCEEKHSLGSTRNVAPDRTRASHAGRSSSSVSATSASLVSSAAPSHAATRADAAVARNTTNEDIRCGTAMDCEYALHPIAGSCIPITAPSEFLCAGTPSASAPRRGGRLNSGFGPARETPWPTRRTSTPSASTAAAIAN
mmetsp:Transcript_2261/g.8690  ORF Transcript_2261/g.8690 Transcript_2261/m.8690 type:complete len:278 (+) Transcript_2261:2061-2894(+)